MVLILLLVLAAIPLFGIVWIALYGSLTTVDGLFMSLILLAMSGILGLTALFELKQRIFPSANAKGASAGNRSSATTQSGAVRTGRVQEVAFFEAHVGEPNKSIVTLNNGGSPQTLVLEGDMRNALPVGRSVRLTVRKEGQSNVLVDVSYS